MIAIMISNWFLEALVAGNITSISVFFVGVCVLFVRLFYNLAHYFSRTKYLSQNRLEAKISADNIF